MDKDIKPENKREFIRVPECSDIFYEATSDGKKKKSEAKDISQSGIRFFVEADLAVGSVIEVSLSLERLEFSFTAPAEVRWSKEIVKGKRYEIGVKFLNVPDVTTKKLINYIQAVKRLDSYT